MHGLKRNSPAGKFRVRGILSIIFPAYLDFAYRIIFFGDEIESIESFDPLTGQRLKHYDDLTIFPANIFVTSQDKMKESLCGDPG